MVQEDEAKTEAVQKSPDILIYVAITVIVIAVILIIFNRTILSSIICPVIFWLPLGPQFQFGSGACASIPV
ncbi:MAG: hypothetical protein HY362_03760 [Candidatus Aenigmarchaeota archaeon]|nr:hypothetical protein [Candidatus Aenigmarchaeota archaeon]